MQTFQINWPETVKLHCYTDPAIPRYIFNERIVFEDISALEGLKAFKNSYAADPKANGDIDGKYHMKFDAIKFAHKVYSLIDGATRNDADIYFWLDADTVTHSKISEQYLLDLIPEDCYTAYLGRDHLPKPMYSECGFVGYRATPPFAELHAMFMDHWKDIYDSGFIFHLPEWHDSWIYDFVRTQLGAPGHSWSRGLPNSTHPFLQKFGNYMDHLKGPRKQKGKSGLNEILIQTDKPYWT